MGEPREAQEATSTSYREALIIEMAQRVYLAVSLSRHFCNSITNISPIQRETVGSWPPYQGPAVAVAVWGKMFRGCAGMRRLWYVGFSRPQNAPSRASASPLPTVRHLTAFTPGRSSTTS